MSEILIPLNIPNVDVVNQEITSNGDIIVTVESKDNGTNCKDCGRRCTKRHGKDEPILLRHLPSLGHKVYIRIYPIRYTCDYCDNHPTTTERLSWYNIRSKFTHDYEDYLLKQMINSTVMDVHLKEDVSYNSIKSILNRKVNSKVNWDDVKKLEIIGIDEIALKKGHGDFVAIVSAKIDGEIKILSILEDRKKNTVKTFFKSIPLRLRKQVKEVCTDLYDGYINAAREVFGKKVKVVADRFHVAKLYRGGVDNLRKKELRRLKKELSEEEYKELKGAMWALRKNPEKLSDKDKDILERLFKHSKDLEKAYELQNELTSIFNENQSRRKAKNKIKKWEKRVKESSINCFDNFLSTLSTYEDHILNYFNNRESSGFVEGLNNKIKVIKRRCYGIFKISELFKRVQLDLEGYALYT